MGYEMNRFSKGIVVANRYAAPRLKQRSSNGIWYIHLRIPSELYKSGSKDLRLSTGTADKRIAMQLQHEIVAQQYQEWDEQLEHLNRLEVWAKDRVDINDLTNITLRRDGEDWKPIISEEFVHSALLMSLGRKGVPIPQEVLDTVNPKALKHVTSPRTTLNVQTPTSTQSVGQLIPLFEAHLDNPRNRHVSRLKEFAAFRDISQKNVSDIDQWDVGEFLEHVAKDGNVVLGTLRAYKTAISVFLMWCSTKRELGVTNNVTKMVREKDIPTKASTPRIALTLMQSRQLVKDFEGSKFQPYVKFMLATGVRVSESLQAEEKAEFNEELGCWVVDYRYASVKTKSSRRTLPIRPDVEIPPRPTGSLERFKQDLNEAYRERGWELVTNHVMRHTFIDALREAGVGDDLRRELVGQGRGSVHASYGSGFSLKQKLAALQNVVLPW